MAVERGATLRFSADRALHPLIVDPATHYARLQPLLRAWRAPNVRLTGGGVIDGGGVAPVDCGGRSESVEPWPGLARALAWRSGNEDGC